MKPFRWNLRKREQLGGLLKRTPGPADPDFDPGYEGYEAELAECAAKVVARSANRRLIFVGRSPENIFDYLSGVFEGTSHDARIDLLNISNRFYDIAELRNEMPDAYRALKAHFRELAISPRQILAGEGGVCFCDLVAEGGTFQEIFRFLELWALEPGAKIDLRALALKLGFLGITRRTKTSPNAWRWQQHADWVREHDKLYVKNLSASHRLWDYLGNRQTKVAKTNHPERWGGEEILAPPREDGNLRALTQAYEMYRYGGRDRAGFIERIAATPEFKAPWLRNLASELKIKGASA